MSQEIQGPIPSLSWAVNQRSGKSSPSQECQEDPSQRARVSLLPEMGENWRSEEGLSRSGWPLGARATMCTWHSLGPPGIHWPYFSDSPPISIQGESPQEHEVQAQECFTDFSADLGEEAHIVCLLRDKQASHSILSVRSGS